MSDLENLQNEIEALRFMATQQKNLIQDLQRKLQLLNEALNDHKTRLRRKNYEIYGLRLRLRETREKLIKILYRNDTRLA